MLPRLHVVTDDAVLAEAPAPERLARVLEAGGRNVALHLRGHGTTAARLCALGAALAEKAAATGSWLLVNDRIDVALAIQATGVQLGWRSVSVADARRLVGERPIGVSVHAADECVRAEREGATFVIYGQVYASATHPGAAPTGVQALSGAAAAVRIPVIGIGGIEPKHVREVRAAGAWGVAVVSGVLRAADPADAMHVYLRELAATPL